LAGPPDPARWEYLRNVLVRYLATPPDSDVRSKLEPAIMVVLGLTAAETAGIKAGRQHVPLPLYQGQPAPAGSDAAALLTGTISSLFDTAASLLGGGSQPGPAAGVGPASASSRAAPATPSGRF
jgi:hypothetical protein